MCTLQYEGFVYIHVQAYAIASSFMGSKSRCVNQRELKFWCAPGETAPGSWSPHNLHAANKSKAGKDK